MDCVKSGASGVLLENINPEQNVSRIKALQSELQHPVKAAVSLVARLCYTTAVETAL